MNNEYVGFFGKMFDLSHIAMILIIVNSIILLKSDFSCFCW